MKRKEEERLQRQMSMSLLLVGMAKRRGPQVSGQGPPCLPCCSFRGFVFPSFLVSPSWGSRGGEFANMCKETRCPRAQISEAKCGARGRVFTCLTRRVKKSCRSPQRRCKRSNKVTHLEGRLFNMMHRPKRGRIDIHDETAVRSRPDIFIVITTKGNTRCRPQLDRGEPGLGTHARA